MGREHCFYFSRSSLQSKNTSPTITKTETHIALEKTTPGRRPVEPVLTEPCQLLALPRIGVLYHLSSAADAGCETTSDPTTGRPKETSPISSNGLACLLARTCLWLFSFFSPALAGVKVKLDIDSNWGALLLGYFCDSPIQKLKP